MRPFIAPEPNEHTCKDLWRDISARGNKMSVLSSTSAAVLRAAKVLLLP